MVDNHIKEELKRVRQEKALKDEQEHINLVRANSRAEALDERQALTMTTAKDQKVTLWQKAHASADEATKPTGMMSYSDWRSTMFGLIVIYDDLVEAINRSITNIAHSGLDLFKDAVGYPLIDKVRNAIWSNPDVDLPKLTHNVSLDAENRMQFDAMNIEFSDEKGVKHDFDANFKQAILGWLDEKGYKPASAEAKPKFVHKDTGEELTANKFNELRDDLDDTLSHEFDLTIRRGP